MDALPGNPRDNQTTIERARNYDMRYTLGLDVIDATGRRARFWFRFPEDRQAFADLYECLRTQYGHTTRTEIV